jgi:ATP-binding cassette subfamily B protein
MREAEVLVLDEPTASLDPRAELAVFEEFAALARGRATFLISHRIGTARLADRILVLRGGRLVEAGNHAELVRAGGEYAQLFAAQRQWYAAEASARE